MHNHYYDCKECPYCQSPFTEENSVVIRFWEEGLSSQGKHKSKFIQLTPQIFLLEDINDVIKNGKHTDTECESCGFGLAHREVSQDTVSSTVILAFSNFEIVGCLDPEDYEGAEYPHPHGWKELLDRGVQFDQIDVELATPEMAQAYLEHFKPK